MHKKQRIRTRKRLIPCFFVLTQFDLNQLMGLFAA